MSIINKAFRRLKYLMKSGKNYDFKIYGVALIAVMQIVSQGIYMTVLNAQEREENVQNSANAIAKRLPFTINVSDVASDRFIEKEVLPRLDRNRLHHLSVKHMLDQFTDAELIELDRLTSSAEGVVLLSKMTNLMLVSGKFLELSIRDIISCIPVDQRPLTMQVMYYGTCTKS